MDSLFSVQHNCPDLQTGVVVSSGSHASFVIPIVDGIPGTIKRNDGDGVGTKEEEQAKNNK